jgi:hypothetical protein
MQQLSSTLRWDSSVVNDRRDSKAGSRDNLSFLSQHIIRSLETLFSLKFDESLMYTLRNSSDRKMKFTSAIVSGILLLSGMGIASAQVDPPTVANTEPVEYSHEGDALLGHLSVPSDGEGPFPAVVIIPDWGMFVCVWVYAASFWVKVILYECALIDDKTSV